MRPLWPIPGPPGPAGGGGMRPLWPIPGPPGPGLPGGGGFGLGAARGFS